MAHQKKACNGASASASCTTCVSEPLVLLPIYYSLTYYLLLTIDLLTIYYQL